ncbi:MAG: hypothetical protein A3D44_02665 [Candidatus Staskawiczbacteria bacterium RIFCSPHIGHO2_02_FULL_42_22]|uniref:Uncharacterized protein n=1 Tax=Candidatus Staskawiczbacteria bacterium RIFCSPHIGHO2_02_FULL_42_22 TaxID=1802207 RepID=A0A1G2I5L0_9BACT|nr:MAG: hypothetical protein A3D44_02665 [Candidatus Staskawiczbacteria bacterium RIFCSPHIGHO2_02_FULL_42_22]
MLFLVQKPKEAIVKKFILVVRGQLYSDGQFDEFVFWKIKSVIEKLRFAINDGSVLVLTSFAPDDLQSAGIIANYLCAKFQGCEIPNSSHDDVGRKKFIELVDSYSSAADVIIVVMSPEKIEDFLPEFLLQRFDGMWMRPHALQVDEAYIVHFDTKRVEHVR